MIKARKLIRALQSGGVEADSVLAGEQGEQYVSLLKTPIGANGGTLEAYLEQVEGETAIALAEADSNGYDKLFAEMTLDAFRNGSAARGAIDATLGMMVKDPKMVKNVPAAISMLNTTMKNQDREIEEGRGDQNDRNYFKLLNNIANITPKFIEDEMDAMRITSQQANSLLQARLQEGNAQVKEALPVIETTIEGSSEFAAFAKKLTELSPENAEATVKLNFEVIVQDCLLYTSPSPRDS